jgi:hypothetical protein
VSFVHSRSANEEAALNPKANPAVKGGSNATKGIISAGEIFADCTMIELVSGSSGLDKPDFLLWNGKRATVGTHIKHGGRTYEVPELGPSVYRATRFPSRCKDYDSAGGLFASMADVFRERLDLPDRESSLLACFSISTWLADRLPTAPSLTIFGPDQELGIDVLRLLSCVCRHPLLLAEVTPSSFRSLPMQLSLTLLLDQQELKPNMQRLFRASSYRGLRVPGNRGRIVDLYGPKAIFCGTDAPVDTLGGGVIHVSVTPSQSQSFALDEQVQNEIANHFQPRLLMYRLKNYGKVCESRIEVSEFTFAMRQLARSVAMCFPEDAELARDAVQLLRPQDEEVRGQRSRDVNCAIVEILLGVIHQRKQRVVKVDELAKDLNALLQSRGELIEHSAEKIGWKLKGLNIKRHSDRCGRQVLLDRGTSQIVHRLARAYDLPSPQCMQGDCPDFAPASRSS